MAFPHLISEPPPHRVASLKILTAVLVFLRDGTFGACRAQSEDYRKVCHRLFPLATAFLSHASEDDSCFAPMNHDMLTNEI